MGFNYGKYFERFSIFVDNGPLYKDAVVIRYELIKCLARPEYMLSSYENFGRLSPVGKAVWYRAIRGELSIPEELLFLDIRDKIIEAEIAERYQEVDDLNKTFSCLLARIDMNNSITQLRLSERAESSD